MNLGSADSPAAGPLRELAVPLPSSLYRFARTASATVTGAEGAPLLVLLGGISANRFPCLRTDGSVGWWAGFASARGAADPTRYRILGIDFIADEQAVAAPSTSDQAQVIAAALDALGEPRAHALIGASYGGMIALAFAELFPDRVGQLVIVSADGAPHPSATASRELQRRVVRLGLDKSCAEEALAIARGMAMLTYRCPEEFADRFAGGIEAEAPDTCSEPGAYLRARGEAFRAVMSPKRFLSLSASIDRHRVDPGKIKTPALLIGAESDQLVPPAQMTALARGLAGPTALHILPSHFGHDMFLKEPDKLSTLAEPFLAR